MEGEKEGKRWRMTIWRSEESGLWNVRALHKPSGRLFRLKSRMEPESWEKLAEAFTRDLRASDTALFPALQKCKGR